MIALRLFADDVPTRDHFQSEALLTWPSIWGAHVPDMLHVEIYEAPRGKAFYVRSHLDIRGLDGGQWNRGRPFATLAEAAREAADLWAEGVRLSLAYWRGEPLRHPGEMVVDAWEATAEARAHEEAIRAARAVELAIGMDKPHALHREASEDRRAAEKARDNARETWVRAQDWRDHRDGLPTYMTPEQTGQLALLEVA